MSRSETTLVAVEFWRNEGNAAAILCTRAGTGVYRVFVGGAWHDSAYSARLTSDGHKAEDQSLDLEFMNRLLDVLPVHALHFPFGFEDSELEAAGLISVATEFAIEKAARKYVGRILNTVTTASKTDIGWEPKAGWSRIYDGPLTVQKWNANARRDRAVAEIEKLEATIEADSGVGRFSDSDTDFAARRRRKLALKRQKKELETKVHGGTNA